MASALDTELIPTITDLLEKADDTTRITLSIFCQDVKSPYKKIKKLITKYGAKLKFEYVDDTQIAGVGYARLQASNALIPKIHKYYLQVDSHMRAIDNWDTMLITEYENSKKHWKDKIVFSAYPASYTYENKKLVFENDKNLPWSMQVVKNNGDYPYHGAFKKYNGGEFGELTNYFCGGFAFGDSKIFADNRYYPEIFYMGEEAIMSIRLYSDNVKIIAPAKNFFYHDYDGGLEGRRVSFFANQEDPTNVYYKDLIDLDAKLNDSKDFMGKFYTGYIYGKYSPKIINAIKEWDANFVREILEPYDT